MMAMTTSSSMSVNARQSRRRGDSSGREADEVAGTRASNFGSHTTSRRLDLLRLLSFMVFRRAHAVKCLVRRRIGVLQKQVGRVAGSCRGNVCPRLEIRRALQSVEPVALAGKLHLPDPVAERAGQILNGRRRQGDDEIVHDALRVDGITQAIVLIAVDGNRVHPEVGERIIGVGQVQWINDGHAGSLLEIRHRRHQRLV